MESWSGDPERACGLRMEIRVGSICSVACRLFFGVTLQLVVSIVTGPHRIAAESPRVCLLRSAGGNPVADRVVARPSRRCGVLERPNHGRGEADVSRVHYVIG
jgi:hypothetical protein